MTTLRCNFTGLQGGENQEWGGRIKSEGGESRVRGENDAQGTVKLQRRKELRHLTNLHAQVSAHTQHDAKLAPEDGRRRKRRKRREGGGGGGGGGSLIKRSAMIQLHNF